MKLKLKEEPREWQKFTLALAVLICFLSYLLSRRGVRPLEFWTVVQLCALALLVSLARPRWFRGFYRAGMTVSFFVGQRMGQLLLMLIFLGIVTPMGWLLRALRKDLLQLKRGPACDSYWRPGKRSVHLDRQF
jgi:hypothetical protein